MKRCYCGKCGGARSADRIDRRNFAVRVEFENHYERYSNEGYAKYYHVETPASAREEVVIS